MSTPLLLVAHGSRDPAAGVALEGLCTAVAGLLPDVDVELAWIEFGTPLLADVLRTPGSRVIVPLLLARGTHLVRDLPHGADVTPPLGPDPQLTEVLRDHLRAAGVDPGRPVVLAATGTRDPDGRADVETQARWLEAAWGGPVHTGYVTAAPSIAETSASLAAETGRTPFVLGYFLAPGRLPAASGATTPPLAGHPVTAQLVVRRYREHRTE